MSQFSWVCANTSHHGVPDVLLDWVLDLDSMTARLRKFSEKMCYQLLFAGKGQPYADELDILGLSEKESCWLRWVLFSADKEDYLFSRVVIPPATLALCGDALTKLGARPLGEILFSHSHHTAVRQEIECALLPRQHALIQMAERYVVPSLASTYARRSLCYYRGVPMLVTDCFLPGLLERVIV